MVTLEERPQQCCGADPVVWRRYPGNKKRMECRPCGAVGRWTTSVTAAIREWNKKQRGLK